MTIFPAIRRRSTRSRSISTAIRCPRISTCSARPIVTLTLSADRPIAALAIRLNEVSPKTGASHLVCYRFCNLADRSGDLAAPERVEPGVPFSFRVTLNLMGHSFKKGWRIRLALSPSFYPTLWESPEAVTVTLHTGESRRTGGERDHPAGARAARRTTRGPRRCCR